MATERRAAFDVGSGATKCYIAEVDPAAGTILNEFFAQEVPVNFALAYKSSSDETLSDAVQAEGIEVLRGFLAECEKFEVAKRSAVATEVFRKAKNGSDYLARVHRELGLELRLVRQEEEARIGFLTAAAFRDGDLKDVLCWDSGGASFQITQQTLDCSALNSYLGCLGTGISAAHLAEVQGRSLASLATLNPVSKTDAEQLVVRLKATLSEVPEWLRGACVIAIGGQNSIFRNCSDYVGNKTFNLEDARRTLDATLDHTDEEIAEVFCKVERCEPASLVVPKICLLVAVMEHCGMSAVRFQYAIGSCPGMVTCNEMYA